MLLRRRIAVLAVMLLAVATVVATMPAALAQPTPPTASTPLRIVSGDGPTRLAEVSVALAKGVGVDVKLARRNIDKSRASALIDGSADLILTGQPLTRDEVKAVIDQTGKPPICNVIARDALAVVVHNANKVDYITWPQLAGAFGGTITNWKDFEGGLDERLRPLMPPLTSDTSLWFKRRMMPATPIGDMVGQTETSAALIKRLEQGASGDTGAIGVVSMSQVTSRVKVLEVTKVRSEKGYKPTAETVANASYPLTRVLYAWTLGRPLDGSAQKKWIDVIRSEAGQKALVDAGYFKLR